jgi:hypothetical protein
MFPVLSLSRNELLKEYKKKIIIKNIIFLKKYFTTVDLMVSRRFIKWVIK